jgi:hypothetical protein
MPPLPLWLAWGLAALFATLTLHGGWRALRSEGAEPARRAPRPGIVELGIGLAGIAMLMPRLFEVYWP